MTEISEQNQGLNAPTPGFGQTSPGGQLRQVASPKSTHWARQAGTDPEQTFAQVDLQPPVPAARRCET